MKCLVIKASPRGARASSSRIADAFVEGLDKDKYQIEEIYLKDQEIKHCTGCYTCWTKTPGRCVLRDDMDRLLPLYEESDLVVVATPLYYFSVPGAMKDFLDRGLPLLKPFLVPKEGDRTSHPQRVEKDRKYVVISTAGFPEKSVFEGLERMFELEIGDWEKNLVGRILIAGAEYLKEAPLKELSPQLYKLVKQAAKDVVQTGRISEETDSNIEIVESERLGDSETFGEIANSYWESQIAVKSPADSSQKTVESFEGAKPCSLSGVGMETLMAGMAMTYNPNSNPGLNAALGFCFNDEKYFLLIQDNKCTAYKGSHPEARFTVISPPEIWEAISAGTLSGAGAMMSGKYRVEGDVPFFMGLDKFFSQSENEEESVEAVEKLMMLNPEEVR